MNICEYSILCCTTILHFIHFFVIINIIFGGVSVKKGFEYIQILFSYALNIQEGDRLFVCLPNTQKDFAWQLEQIARDMGVVDIDIYYHNLARSCDRIDDALEKNAKFLFFTSENDNSEYMKMVRDFVTIHSDVDYTVAVLPSKKWAYQTIREHNESYDVLEDILYHYSSMNGNDPYIDWSQILADNERKMGMIRNFKINRFLVSDLQDTNLSFRFSNQMKGISDGGKIRFFPNYKLELLPDENTVNGYITSLQDIVIDGVAITDLRLLVQNGDIIDYDCTSGYDIAQKLFQNNHHAYVRSVGLVDQDAPLYSAYGESNNFVLDRTSTSSVSILYWDENLNSYREILIPIGSQTLKVIGVNDYDKEKFIYEKQGFHKKLFR